MNRPFVIYSDGPRLPTGLGRITRDLASRLYAEQDDLDIAVLQVGYDPVPGPAPEWPVFASGFLDTEGDWGAGMVDLAWEHTFQGQPGILFSVWDPSRSYPLLCCKYAEQRWGYMPVDATNVHGTLSGPAAEAIQRYDRILAYGRWGSEVLRPLRSGPVPYLPHGLDLDVWTYEQTLDNLQRGEQMLQRRDGEIVIGCVASNQPRKDLGLYFGTLAELRRRGLKIRGWLHVDTLIRSWSVQQLIGDFGLAKKVTVTTSLTDAELASCYSLCGVTIAPGLGEGFCFPIAESLACGTPAVHTDYAGGAELLPLNAWRVPAHAERLEGLYALRRPVMSPVDMANAVMRALDWKRSDERVCQAFCRGSVEYLRWDHLWPRFRSWFRQGLEDY